jgi:ATP-binding cassette subfamily C protein LapB
LGAPYVDEASVIRAATLAGVDQFVRQHPLGYDMPVGENGRMLLGGQRQSVAVARALLLNPQIMVFDEPTSSMDNSTEAAFKQRLGAIARGKTIILVTHRHSMLALVDRLIVLDRGKVVADGPKSGVLEGPDGRARAGARMIAPRKTKQYHVVDQSRSLDRSVRDGAGGHQVLSATCCS